MLVLSRHQNESIIITTPEGRRIVVTVVDTRIDKARIGIAADAEVIIHRSEVQDRIDAGEAFRVKN
jgi:carbon storage regulator CsrA